MSRTHFTDQFGRTTAFRRPSPQALIVDTDAGVVVRAPTLHEILALNLSDLPPDVLAAMGAAVRQEQARRLRDVPSYRVSDDPSLRRSQKARRDPSEAVIAGEARRALFVELMEADWSDLFVGGSEERCFYVYVHYDPYDDSEIRLRHGGCEINIKGRPFYVGKGTGDRAYCLKRNDGHGAILRQLRSKGAGPSDVVQIVAGDLSEREALELESKLCYFFGSRYDGREPGLLVNVTVPPRPPIAPLLRHCVAREKQKVAQQTKPAQ